MSLSKIAGIVLGSAALVAGHGYVTGAVVDGTYYGGYLITQYPYESDPPDVIAWSEDETDLGYIDGSEYSNSNIICHKDAEPGALEASVSAGGSVELQWSEWPSSHHGPVITYLANCNGDCSSVDKTALEFFKIDEGGLIDDTDVPGTWASDQLINNNNSRTVTIPSSIASGNYVLRHEIIALHSAENTNGAQNYPQCINLKVTGGGSDSPSGTLGTALYKNTDPGILVNIYQSLSSYTIPGPALYTGASSSSGSTTSAASIAASTTAAAVTTAAPSTVASVGSISSSTPTVSASPIRSPSVIPHFYNSTRLPRPSFTRGSGSPSAPSGQFQGSQPGGTEVPAGAASTVTEYTTAHVTADVTVTDKPVVQTASAEPEYVTVTASANGQSAAASTAAAQGEAPSPSATPSAESGSSSSDSGSSDSSSSSSSSSGSSSSSSSSTSDSSSYNSSNWSSYLTSLDADELLTMIRQTLRWLVSDKKHARDLSH